MSTTEQILHVESLLRKACLLSIAPRYHRAYSEERQRTYLGVICSALSIAFVIYAGFLEVAFYRSVETVTEAEVEDSLHGIFQLYVNITFPFEKCSSIDVVWSDLHGVRLPWPNDSLERAVKVKSVWLNESVWTNQASQKKTECGSCYGAETDQKPCCNTCSEVILGYIHRGWSIPDRETFAQCVTAPLDESHTRQDSSTEKRIEGCNLEVTTMINRLSGKLEFLPHMNPFLFFATNLQSINPDHIIHAMYFGETSVARTLPSPLNGRKAIRPNQSTDKMLYNYFVTIVPTILRGINGTEVEGFQYSTWSHSHTSQETAETIELIQEEEMQENVHSKSTAATSGNSTAVAVVDVAKRALQRRIIEANSPTGLYISYDTSPLILHLRQRRPFRSGIHFILNIFSVVGGIFTTVALVDSFLYRSIETIKERLGKQA